MHGLTQFLVSVSSITVAGALVALVRELQQVRKAIESKRRPSGHINEFATSTVMSSRRSTHQNGGFAIFVYRDGSWHLEADLSAPGCEVSPPTIKGSFNGQVVKKEATGRN